MTDRTLIISGPQRTINERSHIIQTGNAMNHSTLPHHPNFSSYASSMLSTLTDRTIIMKIQVSVIFAFASLTCLATNTTCSYEYLDEYRHDAIPFVFPVTPNEVFWDKCYMGLSIDKVVQDGVELVPENSRSICDCQPRLISSDSNSYIYWLYWFDFISYVGEYHSEMNVYPVSDTFTELIVIYSVVKRSKNDPSDRTQWMDGPYTLTVKRFETPKRKQVE